MLKHFQQIDLPGWEHTRDIILRYLDQTNQIALASGFKNLNLQRLVEFDNKFLDPFTAMGFTATEVSLYIKKDYHVDPPHMDYSDVDARINIPILNCDQVETQYYGFEGEEQIKLVTGAYGAPYYKATGPFVKLDHCIINQPTVISIKTLHTVFAPAGSVLPRIAATFKVYPDPITYLQG